jgi:predicted flavoprotein YhiN
MALYYPIMPQQKKLIIIGGGAAGFFCAINAAEKNPDLEVTLIVYRGKQLKPESFRNLS